MGRCPQLSVKSYGTHAFGSATSPNGQPSEKRAQHRRACPAAGNSLFGRVYGEEGYAGDAKKLAAEQTGEKTVVAFKSERSPCLSRGTFYFS